MKLRYLVLAVSFVFMFLCAGCQSQPVNNVEKQQPAQPLPYSKGPDGPPVVNGPTTPPPVAIVSGSSTQAQAVTETENVQYTLP